MTGTDGERESDNSVLSPQFNDGDDDEWSLKLQLKFITWDINLGHGRQDGQNGNMKWHTFLKKFSHKFILPFDLFIT